MTAELVAALPMGGVRFNSSWKIPVRFRTRSLFNHRGMSMFVLIPLGLAVALANCKNSQNK